MKAATIYDVARHAGVSHQTVSRYLGGFQGIRPATRERVEAALAELQYRPNFAARALKHRRANRIGVLADRIDEHGPARVISGATRAAHERGFLLDVMSVDGLDAVAVEDAVNTMRANQVVGILSTAQTELVRDLLREQVTDLPAMAETLVTADDPSSNEYAGAVAADHLIDLGHRRLGYLGGPDAWIASQGRRAGFVDRATARGASVDWVESGDWSARSGYEAWQRCCSSGTAVTAVAAANDSMAIGVIAGAAGAGVAVPEQLSVIGTDDIPEAAYLVPALTTVALDFEGEGRAFIAALLDLVDPRDDASEAVRPPQLVVRGTTGPPPVTDR